MTREEQYIESVKRNIDHNSKQIQNIVARLNSPVIIGAIDIVLAGRRIEEFKKSITYLRSIINSMENNG